MALIGGTEEGCLFLLIACIDIDAMKCWKHLMLRPNSVSRIQSAGFSPPFSSMYRIRLCTGFVYEPDSSMSRIRLWAGLVYEPDSSMSRIHPRIFDAFIVLLRSHHVYYIMFIDPVMYITKGRTPSCVNQLINKSSLYLALHLTLPYPSCSLLSYPIIISAASHNLFPTWRE